MENVTAKIKSKRGFAAMSLEKRRAIASMGGKAVKAEDRSFSKDRDLASRSGRKGGLNVAPEKRAFALDKALAASASKRRKKIKP